MVRRRGLSVAKKSAWEESIMVILQRERNHALDKARQSMLRSVKPHSSWTTPGASRDRWKAHAEGASIAAQMIISGKPCQPKDCASMVIESASFELEISVQVELFDLCAAHRLRSVNGSKQLRPDPLLRAPSGMTDRNPMLKLYIGNKNYSS